jgi:hypothetical protein
MIYDEIICRLISLSTHRMKQCGGSREEMCQWSSKGYKIADIQDEQI